MTASSPRGVFRPYPGRTAMPLFVVQSFQCISYVLNQSLFSHCSVENEKNAVQIYKFFMTIPKFLDLFHIHTSPFAEVL